MRLGIPTPARAPSYRLTRDAGLPFPLFFDQFHPLTPDYETHLSSIQAHAQTAIWVSRPHEDQERACNPLPPPSAWSQASPAQGCRDPLRAPYRGLINPDPNHFPEPPPAGEAGAHLVPAGGAPGPVRFRFPKAARLTESGEFSRVKRAGRSFHGRYMIMGVYRDRPSTRFGMVTSRRVGNAVLRNRLRRRLREMVRMAQPGILPGLWIVLIVRSAAGKAGMDGLRSEFVALGTRAGIFAKP